MKLISLNVWGGTVHDPLLAFIEEHSLDTDIFCLQEVLKDGKGKTLRNEVKNLYNKICDILPDHVGYFSEYGEGGYYSEPSKSLDFKYGIACFVRSTLKQDFVAGITLYDLDKKWNDYTGRLAAGAALAIQVEDYAIINVHGMWQGSIKTDTEAKIEQSYKILDLAEKVQGLKVICGDFNMLPNTQAIRIFQDRYTDLIQEHDIKSTRSSLYTKELKYSDYAFLEKEVPIHNFSVPNIVASDHLPLFLELE